MTLWWRPVAGLTGIRKWAVCLTALYSSLRIYPAFVQEPVTEFKGGHPASTVHFFLALWTCETISVIDTLYLLPILGYISHLNGLGKLENNKKTKQKNSTLTTKQNDNRKTKQKNSKLTTQLSQFLLFFVGLIVLGCGYIELFRTKQHSGFYS